LASLNLIPKFQPPPSIHLNLRQDRFLELSLDLLSGLVGVGFAVQVKKSAQIELGCLKELDLSDVNILKRVDALGGLLDLATDDLRNELGSELSKGAAGCFTDNDFRHLLTDSTDLRRGGVGGLLDLIWAALSESDGKETEEVVVSCLDGDVGLDQGLPLADERSELVRGEIETVEISQAVSALNFINAELDLAECVVLILL